MKLIIYVINLIGYLADINIGNYILTSFIIHTVIITKEIINLS